MKTAGVVAFLLLALLGLTVGEDVKAPEGLLESVLVNAAQLPRPAETLRAVADLFFPADGPAAAFLGSMRSQLGADFKTEADVLAAQRQLEESAISPGLADTQSNVEGASILTPPALQSGFEGRSPFLRGIDSSAPSRRAHHHHGHYGGWGGYGGYGGYSGYGGYYPSYYGYSSYYPYSYYGYGW